MPLSFGDVYYIPQKFNPQYGQHYVVILGLDKDAKKIYLKSLSSRIYKIFPNFGSFRNLLCSFCSVDSKMPDYKKQLYGKYTPISVDEVVFLNFKKEPYNKFLSKETFLALKRFEKDNLYDFESRVASGDYTYQGNLTRQNCQSAIITARESESITNPEVGNMMSFFKQTRAL